MTTSPAPLVRGEPANIAVTYENISSDALVVDFHYDSLVATPPSVRVKDARGRLLRTHNRHSPCGEEIAVLAERDSVRFVILPGGTAVIERSWHPVHIVRAKPAPAASEEKRAAQQIAELLNPECAGWMTVPLRPGRYELKLDTGLWSDEPRLRRPSTAVDVR